MITAEQEMRMAEANGRSGKKRQDKTYPMVIHTTNARLMPNTPRLRVHKDYRVYTGALDATEEQRFTWLAGAQRRAPRIVDSSAPAEAPFDLAKATSADIVLFAFENFGKVLDETKPLAELKAELKKMADAEESADIL